MKSLTAITGNMDDMDQTVLSVEEFARLTNSLAALRLENVQLRAQRDELLEALNRMVCNPNAPNLAFARAAIAKCK